VTASAENSWVVTLVGSHLRSGVECCADDKEIREIKIKRSEA
jgi:hypothetical protein